MANRPDAHPDSSPSASGDSADQATIDSVKLNLEYCRIVAPLAGRLGLRQIDPGNYVQTSDAGGIVVITQLEPISVIFTVPEDNVSAIVARLKQALEQESFRDAVRSVAEDFKVKRSRVYDLGLALERRDRGAP